MREPGANDELLSLILVSNHAGLDSVNNYIHSDTQHRGSAENTLCP